jgi:carbon storage regulator
MLVLTRKLGESLVIAEDITVTVIQIASGQIRLGVEAPRQVRVLRQELSGSSPPPGLPGKRGRTRMKRH